MTTSTNELHLAMPIGIPVAGSDVEAYYQNLKQAMAVTVANSETVRIWTKDDDQYTSLFAMAKGALRFLPLGVQGPKSIPVAVATLVLKIWIWDYLNLRKCVAQGKLLPKLVTYSNVDEVKVRAAIEQEVGTNPRYMKKTAVEKAAIVDAFMTDGSRLLVSAGTPIGRGLPDSSADAPMSGARRVDIEFVHRDGTTENPNDIFEVWGVTLGPVVEAHPLLGSLRGPIVPSVAPIEGGLRVRIEVPGLIEGAVAEIAGAAIGDLMFSTDGKVAYGTLPPAAAGAHGLTIKLPGGGKEVVAGRVTYISDVVATTRAVMLSHAIRLQELREQIKEWKGHGGLDISHQSAISAALADFQWRPLGQIVTRSAAGGGSFLDPAVEGALKSSGIGMSPLLVEIYDLLE